MAAAAAAERFAASVHLTFAGDGEREIGKADELPVHNRKWVGNQTNRGGYIW